MASSAPRCVEDLLVAAVPDLRDRLLEHRIRRAWPAVVGGDAARRAQPRSFAEGCLTVVVDNSPWLHELTLRSDELTRRLAERFGAVRSLRFVSGTVEAEPQSGRAGAPPPVPLDAQAQREIDAAASAIADPGVAAAARRLLMKAWPGLPVILLAAVLAGCASTGNVKVALDDETPRRAAADPDPRAEAYYAYTLAQLDVQAGRFQDAIPLIHN